MKSQKAPGNLLPRSECSIEGSSNEELHGSSEVSKLQKMWLSGSLDCQNLKLIPTYYYDSNILPTKTRLFICNLSIFFFFKQYSSLEIFVTEFRYILISWGI